jgi:SSS family solute:Na+ symporter
MALQVKSILGTLMNVQNVSVGVMVIFLFILYKPSMLRKSSATACLVVNLIIMALWLFVPAIHAMNIIYLCWPIILVTFFITVAVDKRTVEIPRYTEEELKAIN